MENEELLNVLLDRLEAKLVKCDKVDESTDIQVSSIMEVKRTKEEENSIKDKMMVYTK